MEDWQENYIRNHLKKLVEYTNCNSQFLFQLKPFLSKENEVSLEIKLKKYGRLEQAKLFYEIVICKPGSYQAVATALNETKQFGAFCVFEEGFKEYIKANNIKTVLPHIVSFQGTFVSLYKIVKQLELTNEQSLLAEKYLKNPIPDIGIHDTVPKQLKYYIPRRVSTRYILNPELFHSKSDDVFVVQNIQLHELSALVNHQGTSTSSDQTDGLTARFIVLENEKDYDKICRLSRHPVHFLHYEMGRFKWIKSHGDITTLQKYVDNAQEDLDENEFISLLLESNTSFCVSDTPGMGKTVLLQTIAHFIRQKHPARLVIFIVLTEFVKQVKTKDEASDPQFLTNLIVEHVSETVIGKEIVTKLLGNSKQVVDIIFDGFDEVLASQVGTAKMILSTIGKVRSVRLFVSTRPHMRNELENVLEVLGYGILPFGEMEQVEFLTKYWESFETIYHMKAVEFAQVLLNKLRDSMNDYEQGIAGIPLQCSLLAEVYREEAIRYCKLDSTDPNCNYTISVDIRITSIFEMYKKLMEMRFRTIQIPEASCFLTTCKKWSARKKIKFIINAHIYAAFELIFPESAKTFKRQLIGNIKVDQNTLCTLGILEKLPSKNAPRFVHRTFAEHLVGLFIAHMLLVHPNFTWKMNKRAQFLDAFFTIKVEASELSKIEVTTSTRAANLTQTHNQFESATFQYPVICYFINAHLGRLQEQSAKIYKWIKSPEKLYELLIACITHDYSSLYLLVIKCKAHNQLLRENPNRLLTLLQISAKNSSIELFRRVHQQCRDFGVQIPTQIVSKSIGLAATPLHLAVQRGHFSITEYLINSLEKDEFNQIRNLIHCCVIDSVNDDRVTLSQKSQIIKLLWKMNSDCINEQLSDGTTPLLTVGLHVSLMETLLACGANLVHKNCKNENVFHVCAKHGNHDALMCLLELNEFENSQVFLKNNEGLTPLMQGFKFGKGLNLSILKLLESKGVVITNNLASESLRSLMRNKNITVGDLKDEFVEVLDYLTEKGGVLTCNNGMFPWNLKTVQRSINNFAQLTHCNEKFLEELAKRKILTFSQTKTFLRQSYELYTHLITSNCEGSFEGLCASLIACNQTKPFLLLKQCFLKSTKFVTPPKRLREFMQSKDDHVLVLRSWKPALTISKIRDTIDPQIMLLQHEDLENDFQTNNLMIFQCTTSTPTLLNKLADKKSKIICICKYSIDVPESGDYLSLDDEFRWEDLSPEFQKELATDMFIEIAIDDKSCEYKLKDLFHDLSMLNTELLAELISGHQTKLIEFSIMENKDIYLNPTVFNFFFSDQVFFQDIKRTELETFGKFGQKIGGIEENIKDVEYVLIDHEKEFDQISKPVDSAKHLVIYDTGRFKLIRSEGSINEIKKFIEKIECDEFPFCNCKFKAEDLQINLSFELSNGLKTSISTNIQNISCFARKILKIQETLEIRELVNFVNQLKYEITIPAENEMKFNTTGINQFVQKITHLVCQWFGTLNLSAVELIILKEIAVTKLFPGLSSRDQKFISELITLPQTPFLNLNAGKAVFHYDILAWYVIAELVLKDDKVDFVNLEELRSKIFHDCFEFYSKTLDGETGIFKYTTFKNIMFFRFLDILLSQKKDYTTFLKCFQAMLTEATLQDWVYACVHANHLNLLKLIVSVDVRNKLFLSQEILLLAAEFGRVTMIEFILEANEAEDVYKSNDVQSKFEKNFEKFATYILRTVALRGNHDVMKCFLSNRRFKTVVKDISLEGIIRLCVINTHKNVQHEVSSRKQILNHLFGSEPLLLSVSDPSAMSNQLIEKTHLDLILHLETHGINFRNIDGENILHKCPEYMDALEYDKLVQYMHSRGTSKIFHATDIQQRTPLQVALKWLELLDSTLETFSFAGADFNFIDAFGDPLLFHAVRGQRSARVIETIIRCGADVHMRGRNFSTVLHEAAAYGNLTSLKYFLYLGCDVNAVDKFNRTPLHEVLKCHNKQTYKIVKVLVQFGASLTACSKFKETPLSLAVEGNKNFTIGDRTVEFLKAVYEQRKNL
ncbi:unnamed protein product [Orchesella dallaii]|uniref:NACHT domain-containing protein n=1 Tax=Orchesella dallaii TaxID=48710 RepID=A0ABP1RYH3_9HEXA